MLVMEFSTSDLARLRFCDLAPLELWQSIKALQSPYRQQSTARGIRCRFMR